MFKEVKKCRCCQSDNLFQYLDLGEQPLANSYHKGENLPLFPLQVMLCEDCFHSQLSIVVKPSLMFKNYLYVSGTTHTFRKHCQELVSDALTRCSKKSPKVLDIACNEGTLLQFFQTNGCEVQGVDPAENLRQLSKKKDIPVEVAYWDTGIAERFGKKFDIITGTNVFAHVNDIYTFLGECYLALEDDGLVILEFPYCDEMISHCEFDTIYHEHLSYFLASSFLSIIERTALHIDDVLRTPIHGGSIRFFLRKGSWGQHSDKIHGLIEQEKTKGLLCKDTYLEFAQKVENNKLDLITLVNDLKSNGKKVVGYGASAKGNTLLNYAKIQLDYIVDDNPMKWGFQTPGQNIPIVSPEILAQKKELYIVVLSWNFFDEIVKKIQKIAGDKHCYIKYVPEVEIEWGERKMRGVLPISQLLGIVRL